MMTHHFKFSELEKAYDVFKHAAENQAMKVVWRRIDLKIV